MKTGIELIAIERKEQIEKHNWTLEHDKNYENNELLFAAEIYLMAPFMPKESIFKAWPWAIEWLKLSPENRIKELAKSGALIAAEIDRLQTKL